jgi:coenzyme F420-0:L-glutamate ligase/coenzyme F420-1:gamma-L-glutamate ligase
MPWSWPVDRAAGELTIRPVHGIGEVTPGADLAALIADAAPWLADGDVLVVTSKIVSKAEGRLVPVPPDDGPEREAARAGAIDKETARVVAQRGPTRIVQTHHGLVLAAAGIDASNVDRGHLVLLPVDPDGSAEALRTALRERHGLDVAVIVTDTMGRPWRLGLTDVAIGAAGIGALRDYRGGTDAYGNELHVTQIAVIDELAAAGELVKGKADQVPVAVVRGFTGQTVGTGARALVRAAGEDMFALGTAEARAEGLRAAATLPDEVTFADAPLPPGALDRALSIVDVPVERLSEARMRSAGAAVPPYSRVFLLPGGDSRRVGAAVHRLRAALAAEGCASVWLEVDFAAAGVVAVGVTDSR